MPEGVEKIELEVPEKMEENWELWVRDHSRFPERYLEEGIERTMAEALWDDVLRTYPGLMAINKKYRPSLSMAAGGFLERDSWAVGQAAQCIRQAKICGQVARTMVGSTTP